MNHVHLFKTERLYLRPTIEEDAEFIFRLLNMPKWIQYIGDRNVHSVDDAKDYIVAKMLPQLESHGYSNCTIIRKSDHMKLGTVGLYDREGLDGIDIGYALLPEYEKMGYAYEASQKMLELGFNQFGISVISAITAKDNLPSQRLLDKLGLERQGTVILPNETIRLWLYRIHKEEYSLKF